MDSFFNLSQENNQKCENVLIKMTITVIHITKNMVTNSSRILHLIALVIGEMQTQLQVPDPQILGND